jgi:diguanylate cyclase (GGDEF)-like protein
MHSGNIKDYIRELQQATDKITSWLNELQNRAYEIDLFFEKGDLLQAALTPDEAYAVISQLAKQLFPTEAGALYLRSTAQSQDRIEAVATWGSFTPDDSGFAADECWALRSGRVHLVNASSPEALCKHVNSSPGSSLCVPMMAHGEGLGVLHLRSGGSRGRRQTDDAKGRLSEAKQRLAVAVAGHIAMAIANLRLRELLSNQANRDSLTGLYNRRYLGEAITRELRRAARHKRPLGIIMFDIDHFKKFNERFTHLGADLLLRALGKMLQESFCRREGDLACRYGGEEFVLVLAEAPLDVTQRRAEELRKEAKRLNLRYEGKRLGRVTLSLGVAVFPEHGITADVLIRAADTALFRAKNGGRDRVEIA